MNGFVDNGCWWADTIVHEFIHALGFHHEQVRPDRDNFVEIIYGNIPSDKRHNFDLFSGSRTYGVMYDGLSVMHYSEYAFSNYSISPGYTIVSKVKYFNFFKRAHQVTTEGMPSTPTIVIS